MKTYLLASFLLIASFVPSMADPANPYTLSAMNNKSTTQTLGGTSQVLLVANPGRKVFCVENPSAATEDYFIDFDGMAASTTSGVSFDIPPGSLYCFGGLMIFKGVINGNAATTSHAIIVYEGQ